MSDGTAIEWTDATVNAINGCSVVSPGCKHCYAMKLAGTRLKHHPSREGLTIATEAGPVWTGEVRLSEKALLQPLAWRRPRRIFWNAHGDPFHEKVPDEWIDRMFGVISLTPHHVHQVLTKRADRMRSYLSARKSAKPIMVPLGDGTLEQHPFNIELKPPANVWLGTSVEDQERANERIPELLATPAAVRFLSCEPLLGPVDLRQFDMGNSIHLDALTGRAWDDLGQRGGNAHIDWVICGGESGPKARPMHPDWARSLRDQCTAAGVPFFFKQWGAWAPLTGARPVLPGSPATAAWRDGLVRAGIGVGLPMGPGEAMFCATKKVAGRLLDGVEHNGMPA